MNCNICNGTKFDLYSRVLNTGIGFGDNIFLPDELGTASYIQCCQCGATVWGIDSGWYPCLDSDKERWRTRNLKPIESAPQNKEVIAKLDLLKGVPLNELKEMLAQVRSKS